jgi:translocator protein
MLKRTLLFLLINFTALGIGASFTGSGVVSDWYQTMNQAPWTPPGWVFGVAWTFIMICFSIYMAYLFPLVTNKKNLIILFNIQFLLNVSWNPIFFYFRQTEVGLVVISGLLFVIGLFLFKHYKCLNWKTVFIAPYFIWLIIATSLNAYIVVMN